MFTLITLDSLSSLFFCIFTPSHQVMQMDDHAAKVRMQATKAEKLKLSAMKQLESLAGTLAAVADKADSDQLKTQVIN